MYIQSKNIAIVINDMQFDFVNQNGAFSKMGFDVTNLISVINPIAQLKEKFNKQAVPLIYTRANYSNRFMLKAINNRYIRNKLSIPFCIENTCGIEIIDELKPLKNEIVIEKYRYNAFMNTPLDVVLNNLNVDTLYFTGVETHVCVQQTAIAAYMMGYEVKLIEDCLASISKEDKIYALNYCNKYYGEVVNSKMINL